MRKLIKNRRGDISAPIITILLVIASISIAALVISWLFGVGISTSKQANVIIVGTPTLQLQSQGTTAVLYITLKNVGNTPANVIGIYLQGSTTTYTPSPTPTITTIQPGNTISITATFPNVNFGNATSVNGVIQTTAGTIPFIAVIQKL